MSPLLKFRLDTNHAGWPLQPTASSSTCQSWFYSSWEVLRYWSQIFLKYFQNISQIFLISDSFPRQHLILHSDHLQPETRRETDTSGTTIKVFKEQTIEKPCNQGFQQTNNRETPLSKFSTNNKQKIQQTNNRETLLSGRTWFPNCDLAGGRSQVGTIHVEQHPMHPFTMKGENKWWFF